jgi:hypothetical protein
MFINKERIVHSPEMGVGTSDKKGSECANIAGICGKNWVGGLTYIQFRMSDPSVLDTRHIQSFLRLHF